VFQSGGAPLQVPTKMTGSSGVEHTLDLLIAIQANCCRLGAALLTLPARKLSDGAPVLLLHLQLGIQQKRRGNHHVGNACGIKSGPGRLC